MKNIIFFIPVLAVLSAFLLYRHNGKREFLKFDLVQFFYAFILSPVIFIWGKTAIFVILKDQLYLSLTNAQLFIIDSVFSMIYMYVFAFVVIHSLTKTFSLRRTRDPLYDIVSDSEFFHMGFSHLPIYVGAMAILTFISMVNLAIPLQLAHSEPLFNLVLILGVIGAVISVAGVWLYETTAPNFMRLLKLFIGFFFLIHSLTYFWKDPSFTLQYGVYWFIFSFFLTSVGVGFLAERREEPAQTAIQLPFRLNFHKPRYYARYITKQIRKIFS